MFISTVAGRIGTVNESMRASVIEESARERANRRCVADKTVPWKTFKIIFFLICLIFLIIQSVDFLRIYYTYPTAIQQETTVPINFKRPAITLCFSNTISFETFCFYEPNLCVKPSNIEEFCWEHPFNCRGNTTNLKIPNQDKIPRWIMEDYLVNDSYNDKYLFGYASKARTFVWHGRSRILKCYSDNLHLYQSGSKPKTFEFDFVGENGDLFSQISLYQGNIEPFYPLDTPQVFLAIHSPYVPLNPQEDLHPVKPGVLYETYVQLEKEEHLLPPPYQTDCRDNGPSKDAKESTNPNSFQMCLDLCRSEYNKARYGCVSGMTMYPTKPEFCIGDLDLSPLSSEQQDELRDKRLTCLKNCKQGCLKLHFKSTIKIDPTDLQITRSSSQISFYVKNPEVTVLRHVPLYGSGEIFSYVGGLLGCWLGISVFSFTDITEKFFRMVIRWKRRFRKRKFTLRRFRKRRFGKTIFRKRRFRKRKVQRAPPTSEIHHE